MEREQPSGSPAATRSCGDCTMCCTLLGVGDLNKPPDVWCRHCTDDRGCSIYDSRPQSCRDFICDWLYAPPTMWSVYNDAMRPDRSHVVVYPGGDGTPTMKVDPSYPEAWMHEPVRSLLIGLVKLRGRAHVAIGPRRIVVELRDEANQAAVRVTQDWIEGDAAGA